MPRRKVILASGEVYHVFNQTLDSKKVFVTRREFKRAIIDLWYYRFKTPSLPLSQYFNLPDKMCAVYNDQLVKSGQIVEVYSYCLMNNHFHLLIKQLVDGGISKYLANFQNSYTRFFNIKTKRKGAIFLNQFKAVRIETEEQLLHVSRYIHLNPLTGYIVSDFSQLMEYEWSSLREYLGTVQNTNNICNTKPIQSFFSDRNSYIDFIRDRAAYQRELDLIKHMTFETK